MNFHKNSANITLSNEQNPNVTILFSGLEEQATNVNENHSIRFTFSFPSSQGQNVIKGIYYKSN